jgi:hypothetical protein
MKSINKYFALLCTLGIVVAGLSFITYAGPCYIQTSTQKASEKGCYEGPTISPLGQACPSIVFPNRTGTPIPTQCSCKTYEHDFGIGTSGNEESGRMEQGSVTRSCYSTNCCTLKGPCIGHRSSYRRLDIL